MGIITALGKSIENSQLLRLLHQEIERNDVKLDCRDDLNDQLLDIARYMSDDEYLSVVKIKRRVNILSGITALPVLILAILLFSTRLDKWFSTNISYISDTVFDFFVTNYWLTIFYCFLMFLPIFYFYFLQKNLKN
ncbi:DUF6097 family protein [Providencia stuartii]|uniref:DUF6097 family protein n=1 Tax=Providencia stuartii TaxID=588 RepID=UPI00370C31CD